MASRTFQVYDTENGRVVSIIKRVADGVKLTEGALVATNTTATVATTVNLWPGMLLIGKGIPAGTTVASVDTAATFTMSVAATASGTGLFIVAVGYIPYLPDGTFAVKEVNLEHYRDFFDDTAEVGLRDETQVGDPDYAPSTKTMKGVVIPTDPAVVKGGPTGASVGAPFYVDVFSDEPEFRVSDHISHEPPREQTQKCSFVHFILDDGALLPVLRMPSYDIVPVS